jgi:hypothetical protein
MLIPCYQWSPTQGKFSDIEYQLLLGGIQDGRLRTGSSNNFARIIGNNVISDANSKFHKGYRHDGSSTDTEYQLLLSELYTTAGFRTSILDFT